MANVNKFLNAGASLALDLADPMLHKRVTVVGSPRVVTGPGNGFNSLYFTRSSTEYLIANQFSVYPFGGASDFSVFGFAKPASTINPATDTNYYIVTTGVPVVNGWFIRLEGAGNYRIAFDPSQSGAIQIVRANNAWSLNTWFSFCCTRTGSNGRIYINGTEVTYNLKQNWVNPAANTTFRIASDNAVTQPFDGALSPLIFFPRVLSDTEISRLHNNTFLS